jgi:hypothetical protein
LLATEQGQDFRSSVVCDVTHCDPEDLASMCAMRASILGGWTDCQTVSWATDAASPAPAGLRELLESCLVSYSQPGQSVWHLVGHWRDIPVLVWLHHRGGFLTCTLWGAPEAAKTVVQALQTLFPVSVPPDRGFVYMKFWVYGPQGPEQFRRAITVPTWADVVGNYPLGTRRGLQALVSLRSGQDGGQLLLWHGVPGTGKTWAIRALADSWRSWCDLEYITDPETLFGTSASYLTRVLLDGSEPVSPPADCGGPEEVPASVGRWRLLVLEDTGELLALNAKQETGQALSRLLNTVDGLLGQGLRILLLITTNEELGQLHPAVVRPGRCLQKVEFVRFPPDEAEYWVSAHIASDVRASVSVPPRPTLAELYATRHTRLLGTPLAPRPVGFNPVGASA